jgi:hypothetical protein
VQQIRRGAALAGLSTAVALGLIVATPLQAQAATKTYFNAKTFTNSIHESGTYSTTGGSVSVPGSIFVARATVRSHASYESYGTVNYTVPRQKTGTYCQFRHPGGATADNIPLTCKVKY